MARTLNKAQVDENQRETVKPHSWHKLKCRLS